MKIKLISVHELVEESKFIYVIIIRVTEKIIIMNINLQISETYCNLAEAFSFTKTVELSFYHKNDLEIDLKSDVKLFFESVY